MFRIHDFMRKFFFGKSKMRDNFGTEPLLLLVLWSLPKPSFSFRRKKNLKFKLVVEKLVKRVICVIVVLAALHIMIEGFQMGKN